MEGRIEIRIGTRTKGPPVPVSDDRKPVPAPTKSRTQRESLTLACSAMFCRRSELMPENSVSSPRHPASRRLSKILTAQAPANAAGVPPIHNQVAIGQSIDLLRAYTMVATNPERM